MTSMKNVVILIANLHDELTVSESNLYLRTCFTMDFIPTESESPEVNNCLFSLINCSTSVSVSFDLLYFRRIVLCNKSSLLPKCFLLYCIALIDGNIASSPCTGCFNPRGSINRLYSTCKNIRNVATVQHTANISATRLDDSRLPISIVQTNSQTQTFTNSVSYSSTNALNS